MADRVADRDDLAGQRLGNCLLVRRIESGMGGAYLAERPQRAWPGSVQVAVKVLRAAPEGALTTQQFLEAARAVAALQHPRVLPLDDFGEQEGAQYLVTPYMPDGSLADLITPGPLYRFAPPLAPALVADVVEQAAMALQFAHDRQIAHLDIKPQNLLVRLTLPASAAPPGGQWQTGGAPEPPSPGVEVFVGDFDLARLLPTSPLRAAPGQPRNAPRFDAPEQRSGAVSPATDQYALAGVAYLLLTGQTPFTSASPAESSQRQAVVLRPTSAYNPRLGVATDQTLERALHPDPARRFPAISDFAHALRAALQQPAPLAASPSFPLTAAGVQPQASWPGAIPSAQPVTPPADPYAGGERWDRAAPTQGPERAGATPDGSGASPAPASAPLPAPIAGAASVIGADGAGGPGSAGGSGGSGALPSSAGQALTASAERGERQPMPHPQTPGDLPGGKRPSNARLGGARPSVARLTPGPRLSSFARTGRPPVARAPQVAPTPFNYAGQPDDPGAPLPRKPISRRWRIIAIVVAAALIVSVIGVAIIRPFGPPPDPTLVRFSQLPQAPSNGAVGSAPLFVQSNWSAAEAAQIANAADHLDGLPRMPNTGVTLAPAGSTAIAQRIQTVNGLGQSQVGVGAPMDVAVASNGQYVIETVDGAFQVFDDAGHTSSVSFASLFKPVAHGGTAFGEPHLIFDANSQQWALVVNEVVASNGNVLASYFDVAISQGASPVAAWHVYQIPTQLTEYGECNWSDNPQIGSSSAGFFITGSNFKCGTEGLLNGVALWELPKASYAHGHAGDIVHWVSFPNALQKPLLSLTPATQVGDSPVEWLVGNDAGYLDNGVVSTRLSLWAVVPAAANANETRPSLVSATVSLPIAYADPPRAQQPTPNAQQDQPTPPLNVGDARIAGAEFINGRLYTTFTTAVQWQGDSATRAGAYWLTLAPQLNGSQSAIAARVEQSGVFGGKGGYFFAPSFVADAQGNVAICAQVSATNLNPSVIYSSRRRSDPPNTLGFNGQAALLQIGAKPFVGDHWGDYSGGGLAVVNNANVTPDIWFGSALPDTSAPDDQTTTRWRTTVWELNSGGEGIQHAD